MLYVNTNLHTDTSLHFIPYFVFHTLYAPITDIYLVMLVVLLKCIFDTTTFSNITQAIFK